MDDRTMQFRVGVMVLATILIAGILLVALGEMPSWGLGRKTYTLYLEFPRAPGVTKDTPVRKSGILVGCVADVSFRDDGGILITASIHDNVKLSRGERCQIRGGLLGDAVLEFVMGDAPVDRTPYQAGDRVPKGLVVQDPIEALVGIKEELQVAIQVFNEAGRDIGALAKTVNRLVTDNERQLDRILDETEKALLSFNKAMNNIEKIAGDEKIQEGLRKSLQDLPGTLEQSRKVFDRLHNTIQLVDENLINVKEFTGPLGQEGKNMVKRISGSVDKLDQLLAQMVQLGRTLNSDEGSLGKLLHDPDLYQSLLRASRNVEEATRTLRPIMKDVRNISDKLSRDPAQILREVVQPPAGIK